jgi:hypothetical protein
METLEEMGAYFAAMPHAAPLAVDMALYGPPAGLAGYGLAASMIGTSAVIDLHPEEQTSFEGLG